MTPQIATMLRARQTLLWITTREELRVERAVIEAAASVGFSAVLWDCTAGAQTSGRSPERDLADPEAAIGAIRARETRAVWVMRDLHRWLGSPTTARALKSLARDLEGAPGGAERTVVVISPDGEIPADLRGSATAIDWPLPDRAEVGRILDATVTATVAGLQARPGAERRVAALQASVANGGRELAIDAAVGLTAREVADCYARSLVTDGAINPDAVRQDKASVISASRVLEWYEPDPRGLEAIGGLEELKSWLKARRLAFSPRAKAFGLPAPKGMLLVGIPGCGKSLTAKAVATAWKMPLLRLDLGALRSKYVGESEGNIRRALKTAEAVAPAILWVDEIEKALAGSTGPQGDGGVAADALGTVLTWLQERAGAVFAVATANDVSGLPPELLRKGRFDEIFFVDLPTQAERGAILDAALRQHGRDAGQFDLGTVERATVDFTGAELAALVPEALFRAFAEDERALTEADLLAVAAQTVPLAKTAPEKVTKLREWAKGRARPASRAAEVLQAQIARVLTIDL